MTNKINDGASDGKQKTEELGAFPPATGSVSGCSTCRFWKRDQRPECRELGACRRMPPQVVTRVYTLDANENYGRYEAEVESTSETEWPETKASDWCGEYSQNNSDEQ